jgi:hypothetical protein
MRGTTNSCNTWYISPNPSCADPLSRQRRVKCDGVKPVCGRCMKSNRQCIGFSESTRLILKDETDTVIKRLTNKRRHSSPKANPACDSSSSNYDTTPDSLTREPSKLVDTSNPETEETTPYSELEDRTEWLPVKRARISPFYEQNQVALFCCRETVNLKTLSWIMADDKWIELLPQMMDRSEALTSVIHANASNYLARAAGARSTSPQALTHYHYALMQLQRDLYSSDRSTSDETLFAVILMGVFDVLFSCIWRLMVAS